MWPYTLQRVLDSFSKLWNPKFHFIRVFSNLQTCMPLLTHKLKIYALWLSEHCFNLCISLFNCKTLNRSFDLGTDTDGFVIPSLEIEQENANDDSQADTSSPKVSGWLVCSVNKKIHRGGVSKVFKKLPLFQCFL